MERWFKYCKGRKAVRIKSARVTVASPIPKPCELRMVTIFCFKEKIRKNKQKNYIQKVFIFDIKVGEFSSYKREISVV